MTLPRSSYDVVVVGAGVAGSIIAKQLADAGKSVLVLEAGPGEGLNPGGFRSFVERFYTASIKVPNSPFRHSDNARAPSVLEANLTNPDNDKAYMIQRGPLPYSSNYMRVAGGTTLHWMGTCLRMLPRDFATKTHFGVGVDWPIKYEHLSTGYEKAEWELGVSADVDDQRTTGTPFSEGYDFPMRRVPQSYLDKVLSERLKDASYELQGDDYHLDVVSTPAARNSIPRRGIDPRKSRVQVADYRPVGAPDDPDEMGQRCEGNSSCVPICPVQAKYSALKTLNAARRSTRGHVDVISQAVASFIKVGEGGAVTGICFKKYADPEQSYVTEHEAKGAVYVIAAHAIESAKLLLASNVANSSDMVGRNLMDHPTLLAWGLMPQNIGSFRGPGSTSGIANFRDGDFRKSLAAFRVEIGNWGWSWPAISPYSNVDQLVAAKQFGRELRANLADVIPRQFRFAFLLEQLPELSNRVSISHDKLDRIGIPRPIIDYDVSEYCREGMLAARRVSKEIFRSVGASDETEYEPSSERYFEADGLSLAWEGPGHAAGTHRMGGSPRDSVVDADQRTWDHDNLFLVGAGNFCTIGTSNPTLTIAALAFKASERILKDLHSQTGGLT